MGFLSTDAFVALATIKYQESIEFYCQLLGQKPQAYIPNVYAEFQLNQLRLAIFRPKQDNEQEFANSGTSPMGICLEVENLEQAIAHLQAIGYPFSGKIMVASHGREIYAYDPDGNRLILHQKQET
jgi:predicted enzyme related to lactoylglutathione lyase